MNTSATESVERMSSPIRTHLRTSQFIDETFSVRNHPFKQRVFRHAACVAIPTTQSRHR